MEFIHYPVMLEEAVDGLNIKENGIYVDCTFGGGGHSGMILERLNEKGRLIGIDRDMDALKNAETRIKDSRLLLVHDNFKNLESILSMNNIERVNGVLIDLGISSYQIDTGARGFSYMKDAPLDMRMDRDEKLTAYDIVNTYTEESLRNIFYMYGEERYSKRISENIVKRRDIKPIRTTLELADIIASSIPKSNKKEGHPAKRCFQALRIEVNDELNIIPGTLRNAVDCLDISGRLAVITFHSLEDRIVKNVFNELAEPCSCPKNLPCVCGKVPKIRLITKKAVKPSDREIMENSRSKSAKLRICECL